MAPKSKWVSDSKKAKVQTIIFDQNELIEGQTDGELHITNTLGTTCVKIRIESVIVSSEKCLQDLVQISKWLQHYNTHHS